MLNGKARLLKTRDDVQRRMDEAWVEDVLGVEPPDPFDRRAIRIQYRQDQAVDLSDDSGAYVLAADKTDAASCTHSTDRWHDGACPSTADAAVVAAEPGRWIQRSLFETPIAREFPAPQAPPIDAPVARPHDRDAASGKRQSPANESAPPVAPTPTTEIRAITGPPLSRRTTGSIQAAAAARLGRFAVGRPIRRTANEFSWLRFLSGLAVGGVIGAFVLMLIASAS